MGVNIKSETVKLLVENMRENLCISGIVKGFLDHPNSINHKTKPDKLYFNKIKNFCLSKDTIKKMKRQITDWDKLFAIHMQLILIHEF